MKKFYFFLVAAIAVIASAACTKVDPVPQDIPVSFQVANYVPQTKANEAFDIDQTFTTYAWFQPTSGDAQVFMSGETIRWQSSSNTWAPDRVYYWPKTGYVNFFSYAGTPTPDVTNGTANYSNKTIAITDDALLASAAYKYNSNVNEITGIQYNGTDVTGVPTLFHHVLSKVTFIIKFDASEVSDTKNKWDLVVNSASLTYSNQGTLNTTFTVPDTKGQSWPFAATAINWVPTAGAAQNVLATTVTGDSSKQTTVAPAVSEGKTLFDEVTVMPQDITSSGSNAKFALNYTLTSFYDNVQHIEETVDLTGENAIVINAFAPAINAWNMNYKYVYTITIKPNKTVTFDPAVVTWETAESGYTYPNDL